MTPIRYGLVTIEPGVFAFEVLAELICWFDAKMPVWESRGRYESV